MRGRVAEGRSDSGAAHVMARIGFFLRRIAGMPDYDAYLEHLRCHHPDHPVPTECEFYEEFVRNRYEDGPTRCC